MVGAVSLEFISRLTVGLMVISVYIYIYYTYITRAHVCEACFLHKNDLFPHNFVWGSAQQCTQPQSSTCGGHECEEDVRCHGGVPESTMSFVVGYNPRSHLKESS